MNKKEKAWIEYQRRIEWSNEVNKRDFEAGYKAGVRDEKGTPPVEHFLHFMTIGTAFVLVNVALWIGAIIVIKENWEYLK